MLFVGTDSPLSLREWRKQAPDICVQVLREGQVGIRAHFSKPVVQYVGATSGCGCDFPHWLLCNGQPPTDGFDGRDEQLRKVNLENAQKLRKLFGEISHGTIELYCVWDGNWSEPPILVKNIQLDDIADPNFLFGEQVLYRIEMPT
jgi:hypothetical protein